MSAPEPDFTLDEFIEELNEDAIKVGTGLTRLEIQEATGMGKTWVLQKLRELKKDGKLVVVRKKVEAIDGRMASVPAYRIRQGKK